MKKELKYFLYVFTILGFVFFIINYYISNDNKIFWNCIDDFDGKKTRRELIEPWKDLANEYIVFHLKSDN